MDLCNLFECLGHVVVACTATEMDSDGMLSCGDLNDGRPLCEKSSIGSEIRDS